MPRCFDGIGEHIYRRGLCGCDQYAGFYAGVQGDYLDFSGDNMCHPIDFMSRLYAQICLETIVPGGLGDIDGDGEVTIRDIGALRLYLADKIDGEGLLLDAGDVDKDGELTIRDIGTLRLYLADKITLD